MRWCFCIHKTGEISSAKVNKKSTSTSIGTRRDKEVSAAMNMSVDRGVPCSDAVPGRFSLVLKARLVGQQRL